MARLPDDLVAQKMCCPDCKAPAEDVRPRRDIIGRRGGQDQLGPVTATGVEFWTTWCGRCGHHIRWRVWRGPRPDALAVGRLPAGAQPQAAEDPYFPGWGEQIAAGAFCRPGSTE
jgi:hypothetical protein